ncbi:hypothetical protein ABGB17_11245 [Sphaerisporangium sp. B11E5]|uniref:hypothetical protein n=1 Tax=Sphaerisporangium sp. B11E5 TaxID=3153563 RepID=UPI00325E1A60
MSREEILFASPLEPSDDPTDDQVDAAVANTLAELGEFGCAAVIAGAFARDPSRATARMRWARRRTAGKKEE